MIQEVSTHVAHPALRNSVLPRTAESGPNRLAAHGFDSRDDIGAELRIPVEDQESFRPVAALPSFVQLQRNPKRVGITRNVVVKDSAPVVADDEKAVED